jgi:hypothetical protein
LVIGIFFRDRATILFAGPGALPRRAVRPDSGRIAMGMSRLPGVTEYPENGTGPSRKWQIPILHKEWPRGPAVREFWFSPTGIPAEVINCFFSIVLSILNYLGNQTCSCIGKCLAE